MSDSDKDPRIGRRALLVGTSVAAVSGGLLARAGCARASAETAPELSTWSGVRRSFELDENLIDLAAMYFASNPAPVREAIARHRDGLQRSPARYVIENDAKLRVEIAREAARFFGASAGNVALTDSTTMGLSLLYNGVKLAPGDEVVLEAQAYYSTAEALRYKAQVSGAELVRPSIYDAPESATPEQMRDRLLGAITERTRLLALTWVHSDTGVKLPVGQIAQGLAELNRERSPSERVLLCVDGVHGFGVEDTSLPELGCDFLAAGTHKWLFGPRGTGLLYAAHKDAWDRLVPTIPAFGIQSTPGLVMSPGGFHAFEHRWALLEALQFMGRIGLSRISERTHELALQLKEGLAKLPRVQVLTPIDSRASAGIVAFNLEGWTPDRLAARLLDKGFVVSASSDGMASVRASPSIRNTPQELEALLETLATL